MEATGWRESTVKTYISKQYRDFLKKDPDGRYGVRPEFKRLSEANFLQLTTQKRRVFSSYIRAKYPQIVAYEFLLPLTREDRLRKALDDLFYEDTIRQRISEIGLPQITGWIEQENGESEEDYIRRVCEIVSEKFTGYSISHVSGRFRAAPLQTREQVAKMLVADQRYVIDETTASVRFIIPVGSTKTTQLCDTGGTSLDGDTSAQVTEEISLIHNLFFSLFVEAVVQMVMGEDEIWLLEETGRGNSLYVWERTSDI